MSAGKELYANIVTIVERYLGPAGQRFVDRQIQFHLNKDPNQVTAADLPQLTDWIRVSLALLTDDRSIVDDCAKALLQLT